MATIVRKFKDRTDEYIAKVNAVFQRKGYGAPGFDAEKAIAEYKQLLSRILPQTMPQDQKIGTLQNDFNKIARILDDIIDEENAIRRLERDEHLQTVFYRIVSTLAVGLVIIFIYWAAEIWGIKLPLMRLG